MSVSKSSSSSPSLPSGEQISGDIFFQVKKQILDKLDIILQQVNLQVIEYLKPQIERSENKKSFHFIELSQFQKQIQALFDYLDRLYESLNTSVSFSSNDIKNTLSNMPSNLESTHKRNLSVAQYNTVLVNELGEIKLKYQHLQVEMHRLTEENEHMMFLLKNNLSHSYSMGQSSMNQSSKASLRQNKTEDLKVKGSQKQFKSGHEQYLESNQSNQALTQKKPTLQMQGISLETVKKILRFYNHSIRQLSLEYKESIKEIKKALKDVKFQIIEGRVECISELKKWTEKTQIQTSKEQPKQLKQVSAEKQNRNYSRSHQSQESQRKANSFQTARQHQSIDQICGQTCIKRDYSENNEKIGFQEQILQKIQEILDVC